MRECGVMLTYMERVHLEDVFRGYDYRMHRGCIEKAQ